MSRIAYIANMRLPTEKAHGAQIMKTCEALARAGAEVELIVTDRKSDIAEDPFAYYRVEKNFSITRVKVIDTISFGPLGFFIESLSFGLGALKYLSNGAISYSRDEVPLWIASMFSKRIVFEAHSAKFNFFAKRVLRKGAKVVAISNGIKDTYREKGVEAQICVAPDGIDLAPFAHAQPREEARARLGIPLEARVAMYIGRLDGWKGSDTLLEASRELQGGTVVMIGGEPAQVESLKQKYPGALFCGFRPYAELADNEAAADVLVLPNTAKDEVSARYTSPMKLFAYMASGKTIVASDLPSIREALNERNALFFAPDDPHALSRAISAALAHPNPSLGEQAKRDALSYTWDSRAKTIIDFLKA